MSRRCPDPTLRSTAAPVFRGQTGAKLQMETCAPTRFRHVWTADADHPVNGYWRFECIHCDARGAVPVRGDEVGQ